MKKFLNKRKIGFVYIFLIYCCLPLIAADITFSCNKKNIPDQAKGSYRYDYSGKIYYENTMGKELDLFSLTSPNVANKNLKTDDLRVHSSMTAAYGNNFYDFDDYGNLYFIASASFYLDLMRKSVIEKENMERAVFLYIFNPTDETVSNLLIAKESMPHSFCVSNDGKWAFLDTLDLSDAYNKEGYAAVYSIPTDFSSQPQILYKAAELRKIESSIRNICFDSNVNRAYFSSINDGLYYIYTDDSGNYTELASFPKRKYPSPIPSCALYSNKEGLWGVMESTVNKNNSQLFQITDKQGNQLDPSANILKNEIFGNWRLSRSISAQSDFILFISAGKSEVYKYENKSLENVTTLLPHKKEFTTDDLDVLAETIYSLSNESIDQKSYKALIKLFASICIIFFVILIVLIIWIIYLSQKSNTIKKNKQFIFDIQETERGKISRDIHDSIIQDIRAIRIETELLNVDDESEVRKSKVINLATECVVKLRNICYNLTPAELATHAEGDSSKIELVSIIQSLVLQFIERTHMPCQVKVDKDFDYPVLEKEISQNLFRIIQEALNNIEKHSYATNCQILIKNRIEDNQNHMLIYITDDGIGCDIKQLTKHRARNHFGIKNMQDRANLIGATLEFTSEPGQGLEVKITV